MCCVMGYTGHDLSAAKFKEYLLRTVMRGPDDQRVVEGPFGLMGFGRLAIMGLTPEGMQPFYRGADCVVCNGELYGVKPMMARRPKPIRPKGPSTTRWSSGPRITVRSRYSLNLAALRSCPV